MKDEIKKYYGETLKGTQDLKSNCCGCDPVAGQNQYQDILTLIDDDILSKYYGCGSPLPSALSGCTVLDLGCGTGRDVYLASKLVGPDGHVIGVDMTENQLAVANKHLDSQMSRFGYEKPNVEFKSGDIEDLRALGIEDNSIDVVISNCVINLSSNKAAVFKEILRVLKPGGELYFSDIFSDRRVPEEINSDPVMVAECLGGTLYIEDFRRMLTAQGYPDFRIVSINPVAINSKEVTEKAGEISYFSVTMRLFKVESLEDVQEDYGQTAEYLGTLKDCSEFKFDRDHSFIQHVPTYISSNTAEILAQSRYASLFSIVGDKTYHHGRFDNVYFAGIAPETATKSSCCGSDKSTSCCGKSE